jgi:hypothetical protein
MRTPTPPPSFKPLGIPPCHRRRRLPDAIVTEIEGLSKEAGTTFQGIPKEYSVRSIRKSQPEPAPLMPLKAVPIAPIPLYNPQRRRQAGPYSESPSRELSRNGKRMSLPAEMIIGQKIQTIEKTKPRTGSLLRVVAGALGRRSSASVCSSKTLPSRKGSLRSCGLPLDYKDHNMAQKYTCA